MIYIKDEFSILAECAAVDLPNTEQYSTNSQIKSNYYSLDEASEYYEVQAEMVPIVKIGEEYYTETSFIAPFMRDTGIKRISEALDCIAEANCLVPKSVGLLMESDKYVSSMIEKACQRENSKVKSKVFDKIDKATGLAKSLKKKGYPVRKKKSK